MAGSGYKLYLTGDVLSATDVNNYLQEQTIMVFATSAARTSALSLVLAEGMVSYLQDTNTVQVYNGTAWVGLAGSPLTTKGDLYGFSTLDARVPIGTNNQVLTADSAQALGLKWATPAVAGSGLTFIARAAFSGATTVNIDYFNSTYFNYFVTFEKLTAGTASNDLQLRVRYSGTTASTGSYYGSATSATDTGTTVVTGSSGATAHTLALNTIRCYGYLYFQAVGNANEIPSWNGEFYDAQASSINTVGCQYLDATFTYTGFQLITASNISGTYTIYGLAKA